MPGWNGNRTHTRAQREMTAAVLRYWPACYLKYDGCTGISTEDDHVIPLAHGGTDHWDNHRGACHHCHTIKSKREAAAGRLKRQRTPEPHPGLKRT